MQFYKILFREWRPKTGLVTDRLRERDVEAVSRLSHMAVLMPLES
jgi:hypothetical protein